MKKFLSLFCTFMVIALLGGSISVSAHSGRTDASGGHKDNQNKSGLGPYHYHHGYGPHLHDGGICPYSSKDSITVFNFPNVLRIGDSQSLEWEVIYYTGNDTVTWSSSDTQVVTVSNSGVLNAVGIGSATITATLANGSQSFSVSVQPVYAEEILLSNTLEELEVGASQQLEASVLPAATTDKTIEWSSSNPAVATISPTGNILAISPGAVTISASTTNGVRSSFSVDIFEILPEDLLLSETMVRIPLHTEKEIQVSLVPANVTNTALVWASSDDSIVTIKNGVLYGAKVGAATINVSCHTVTKELEVSVYEVKPVDIEIVPNNIRIEMGKNEELQALLEPFDVTNPEIIWEVADPAVAKLEGKRLNAVSPGKTELTARCQEVFTSIPVEVFDVPVQAIRFVNSNGFFAKVYRLSPGEERSLEIEILPKDTSYSAAIFRTEDETVAQIKNGQLLARGEGTTTLYAAAGLEEVSIVVIVGQTEDSVFAPLVVLPVLTGVVAGGILLWKKKKRIP